ncbi:F0F1 ATP synthase subunit B [Paenibacillus sp. N1-5-1-14]|uniref:F0F1 ATP synthase subunit B n=1 Tax=Paenibacillus radicibacter TaxID=2972488 RepID=UPI0021593351|nr:F0F1 ATP synthase subunit B [Paenibacillus radicibacter]MCR8645093.1 F0F1 ATP synthase subunit B [Paenibacillus radicibacter]
MSFTLENSIIAIVAFAILYFFLHRYALGPLMGVMEQRRTLVADQLANADKNRKDAEALISDQRQALQAAKKEAYDIIEQSKLTASRQADDIIAQAKAETVRLKEEAVRDIEREKSKAIAALRSEVGTMSVAIAAKIIEKQVDAEAQQTLVNQYLNEVGGVQ